MADPFDELANRAGHIVGKQEALLREQMGTDRYDKVLAMADSYQYAQTACIVAKAEMFSRVGAAVTVTAFVLLIGVVGLLIWGFVYG